MTTQIAIMHDTLHLTSQIPLSPLSIAALIALSLVARWLAEVYAFHLPEQMNHEWEQEVAEFRNEAFDKASPSLWHAMKMTHWMPQALRSRRSGSQVDLGQLVADAVAVFGPIAAALLHHVIDAQVALLALMCWVTASVIIIDRNHFLIPDAITLPMIWIGLLANTARVFQEPEWSIASAALAYLGLRAVGAAFRLVRREDGIGLGDMKWLAVTGAWFGGNTTLAVLIGACFAGIAFAVYRSQQRIAFGPMLTLATVVAGLHMLK